MRRASFVPLLTLVLALSGCGDDSGEGGATRPNTTAPQVAPPAHPAPSAPPVQAPRPMSWASAGAFVWHETDIGPEALGEELRANGFGWVAVRVSDGRVEDPLADDWIARFRRASGLPVGGWGVLREEPVEEAALAGALVERHGLDFYIADAEAEYVYSGPDGLDRARFERSARFVEAFRARLPGLPAALSSYCRPADHDLDWDAWSRAGFAFLPQAYVNDFGAAAAPGACAAAARGHFALADVHPTIGMYPGVKRSLRAAAYARLLSSAGTIGFSVYLAETRMTGEAWRELGDAISSRGIARRG